MPHTMMRPFAAVSILLACASAAHAAGGGLGRGANLRPTEDFGIDFVTIGAPGNRAALPEERFYNSHHLQDLGAVGYRYRLSRTEISARQWIDFITAYEPYWTAAGGNRAEPGFTGGWIQASTLNPNLPPGYVIAAGGANLASKVEWRVAAIFCNWLHNGKVNEEWAFQSGAYDISTFGDDPNGGYTDQEERSPGARFWLPSVDEWTKGAHYDPDRYGEGQEGYWLRMGGQDEPLTPGLAENGGETSAGEFLPGFEEQFIDVGSYPHVPGPWGVLDTSGGVQEWTETIRAGFEWRFARGSHATGTQFTNLDLIDWYLTIGIPDVSRFGIRLASAVPAPSGALIVVCVGFRAMRRRRCPVTPPGFASIITLSTR